jgi:hypothetical protein
VGEKALFSGLFGGDIIGENINVLAFVQFGTIAPITSLSN